MAPSPTEIGSWLLLLLLVLGPLAWIVHRYAVVRAVRAGARVLRIDASAAAVGVVALAATGGLVAVAADPGAPLRSALAGLLAASAAAGLTVAVANLDWYRASRSLPVLTPGEVVAGPVQVAGRASAPSELVESSVTRTDSVAYRAVTLEERAVAGRGHAGKTWAPTSAAFDAVPFGLVGGEGTDATDRGGPDGDGTDGGGTDGDATDCGGPARDVTEGVDSDGARDPEVIVDGPAAAYPLLSPTSRFVDVSPTADTLRGRERTVPAEPGTTVPVGDDLGRGERPRPRRYSERRIDPGDEVYVLGTARETGDGYRIGADPDGPPLIVVRAPAEQATAHARKFVVGYGGLGLASLAGLVVLAATLL